MRITNPQPNGYPQLDDRAVALLIARVSALGSRAAVARELDVARTSISQAIDRCYPADTRHLRNKIMERYAAEGINCPHLDRDLSPSECRSYRTRELATGSRASVKHWQACRCCQHNPNARRIDQ